MSERPVLYLDIDGVLATFPDPWPEDLALTVIDGIGLLVPEGTASRVQKLAGHFTPVWATAWFSRAYSWWPYLGREAATWPILDFGDWKLPMLLAHARGRPFAWVDDDADWELRELRRVCPSNALVLNPDTGVGLTDEHVDRLISFAESRAVAA